MVPSPCDSHVSKLSHLFPLPASGLQIFLRLQQRIFETSLPTSLQKEQNWPGSLLFSQRMGELAAYKLEGLAGWSTIWYCRAYIN